MFVQLVASVLFLHFRLTYELANAQQITVYSDHFQQGNKVDINISSCSNLPDGMAGEVTSIDTKGKCASFSDKADCKGVTIEVMSRSPSHNNLHGWGFNDRARSVGPCRDPCHPDVTGPVPKEPLELLIFGRQNFKGPYENLKVEGCTLIPPQLTRQLLSVQPNGKCFQFYNNIQCQHQGGGVDSIELRPGTPNHDDIGRWHFPEARAVSHCTHKCNDTNRSIKPRSSVPETLNADEILLFDQKGFEGNWVKLIVKRCLNLTNPWEGAAESIRIGNQTCVIIFDRRGCKGDSLRITKSQDLSARNFDGITRSIQRCTMLDSDSNTTIGSRHTNGSSSSNSNPYYPQPSKSADTASISTGILVVIIVVPVLGVLLSVSLVLFIMKKCNPYKGIIEMLSEKEIEDFLRGFGMDINTSSRESGDYSVELLAQNQPYNDSYEIPRASIKFDQKSPLGMGEFGVVYKGEVLLMKLDDDSNQSSTVERKLVAVKTVRPNSSVHCLRSLLKEVKVMLYVGKHAHIVDMVGCCTENIRKGEILVLMEFCSRGSMESFLQKHRSAFKNIIKKGRIDASSDNKVTVECPESKMEYQNWESSITTYFDFFQLLRWCIEVAEGMEFLASMKVIHSDLAARNVLLDADFTAKISDFGLSKQLYCYTQYVKKRQEPLPWRWIAIESLKNLEFSTSSDVWGYGVLSWEIFTLGEKPYPGIVWNDNFLRNLEEGLRLPKPKYASTECYNVMIRCWDDDPNCRPSFSEILMELKEISASTSRSRPQSNPVYAIM